MRKTFIVMGLLAVAGCPKKTGDKKGDTGSGSGTPIVINLSSGSGSGSGSAAAPVGSAAPVAAAGGTTVTLDPEIASRVKAIPANCTLDPEYGRVKDCKNGEDNAVSNYVSEQQYKNVGVFETLGELALTEGAKDPKLFMAITETWPSFGDPEFNKKAATPAAVERVLKLYPLVREGSYTWANASRIPLVAGKHAELTATLAKLDPDKGAQQRQQAYDNYLQFGGIDALPDLQDIVKSSKNTRDQGHALQAVGLAVHAQAIKDADATKACDWVKSVLADATIDDDLLGNGLESLSYCGGAYIDAGIATAEANIKAKKLGVTTVDGLHKMCYSPSGGHDHPNGSKEQCAKAFAAMEAGINAKEQQSAALNQAPFQLVDMAKNDPDLKAKVAAVLTKLSTNADKSIADGGKRALADLNKK